MNREKREQIETARRLLQLDERASLNEIRGAYRRLSKTCHPDLQPGSGREAASQAMQELTVAYQVLTSYCAGYPVPLTPEEIGPVDDEEWWLERFGQDPLWSKG